MSKISTIVNLISLKIYLAVLIIFLLLLPPFVGNYWTQILGDIGIYIILGIGLNVVVGFAGLLDLGYVAFYAIGAYGYALLASPQFDIHIPFWLMLPACVALAAGGGALLGIPVLRMRGDYLAIVTLGFGEIIRLFLENQSKLTGGPSGIANIARPSLFGHSFSLHPAIIFLYFLVLVLVILAIAVVYRLEHSRLGRSWIALRED